MAALRIAARRLVGGGGQTPAVSVGEAQRRFFPGIFQVERARSATFSAAAENSNAAAGKGLKETLDEIQNRTKQLYDLTAEAERMYDIPGKAGREVARLRQELAAQVEPTSKDMVWRVI